MIFDLSPAFDDWEQPYTLKTVTKSTVDFVETTVVKGDPRVAVFQPTNKTNLNADTLDWSRDHWTLHSALDIKKGQYVEYKGRDYKVVERSDWSEYGYYEVVCEETKLPLLQLTDDDDDDGDVLP